LYVATTGSIILSGRRDGRGGAGSVSL